MEFRVMVLLLFLLLVIGYWGWCKYISYPVALEKLIRQGKSWLYIPMRWKGNYKLLISWVSPIWLLSILSLGAFTLWLYTSKQSLYLFLSGTVILVIAVYTTQSFWSRIRFKQQMDSYFLVRGQVIHNLNNQGKKLTEQEIDHLASFQHKSMLQKADQNGQLGVLMTQQSALARKKEKTSDSSI